MDAAVDGNLGIIVELRNVNFIFGLEGLIAGFESYGVEFSHLPENFIDCAHATLFSEEKMNVIAMEIAYWSLSGPTDIEQEFVVYLSQSPHEIEIRGHGML